ncbi:MAG: LysM peptidoglycan-binding domain-containing protein [Verrucomicrobia bacterium]|nr:LysM peptidoglycan-binding domain-containing protein [Verrucomicrobiota bacterium]MDA1066601.1 LysM peptidoglycan-binding domain-containing protein [Verrucomicrobiota bacterium]
MKAHVFISVLAFHVVVIAGLYLLSACSSSSGPAPSPEQTNSPSTGGSTYDGYSAPNRPTENDDIVVTEYNQPQSNRGIDSAFNSGSNAYSTSPTNSRENRAQPTRPGSGPYDSYQQPVLNPDLQDEEVLQPLTGFDTTTPAVQYSVKKGDNLWKISRDFSIALKDLLAANGLSENSTINIGQSLVIPSETSGPPIQRFVAEQDSQSEVYTITKGDTLSRIAKQFNTTVNDIKIANALKSDVIQLGQRLTIPVNSVSTRGVSATPTQTYSTPAVAPTPQTRQSNFDGIIHVVQSGETPGAIAKMYGITTSQLMKDNGIQNARSLQVGQKLEIRLGVAQPSLAVPPSSRPSNTQPVATPNQFEDSVFGDLENFPEVEVVPRS